MQFDQKITYLKKEVENYSREELIWFNGYLSGLLAQNKIQPSLQGVSLDTQAVKVKPIILYGSETGNSKKVALELLKLCKQNKLQAKSFDLATYKIDDLSKEHYIILICSTQGEGEPPLSAQPFFDNMSKVSLELSGVKFCVLALGDSSYPLYCKAGEDLYDLFLKQGAQAFMPIHKLDVDYKDHLSNWSNEVLHLLQNTSVNAEVNTAVEKQSSTSGSTKVSYQGILKHSILLNDRESNKQTYHIELETEDAIAYEPGDAIGIYPPNNEITLKQVAQLLGAEHRYHELATLNIQGMSKGVISKLAAYLEKDIKESRMDLLDLLQEYSVESPIDFDTVKSLLQPIAPRLYSVSSSSEAHDREVHLTVSLDQFTVSEKAKVGMCSSFLSDLKVGQEVTFYVHRNSEFYLPSPDQDIIMIGPGTGIAPFRGFLEHRDTTGAEGRNWLFFGEQHFVCDFYYQTEIQQWLESGVLTKLDTAFSRDQKHKIYVQDRLKQNEKEVWNWIQSGAIIYVCGQKAPMSEDVELTLIEIIQNNQQGSFSEAKEYLEEMFINGQYKKDVY